MNKVRVKMGASFLGKTTLIKALTHDSEMRPEDKLFATLDVTAHRGKLPSGMTALFIDTVGFVSDLPHELVESFSATLEDIIHSVSITIRLGLHKTEGTWSSM